MFAGLDMTITRLKVKKTISTFGKELFDLAEEKGLSILRKNKPETLNDTFVNLAKLSQNSCSSYFKELFNESCKPNDLDLLLETSIQINDQWSKTAKSLTSYESFTGKEEANKSSITDQKSTKKRKKFDYKLLNNMLDSHLTSYVQTPYGILGEPINKNQINIRQDTTEDKAQNVHTNYQNCIQYQQFYPRSEYYNQNNLIQAPIQNYVSLIFSIRKEQLNNTFIFCRLSRKC